MLRVCVVLCTYLLVHMLNIFSEEVLTKGCDPRPTLREDLGRNAPMNRVSGLDDVGVTEVPLPYVGNAPYGLQRQ